MPNSVQFVTSSGVGRLIFFNTDESQVEGVEAMNIATIPKLGKRWKVVFDLKTAEYTPSNDEAILTLTEGTKMYCRVIISLNTALLLTNVNDEMTFMESSHQFKIGEWNTIQMTHDEGAEGGRFFVSLSVGDKELGKLDVGSLEQRNEFTNVQLRLSVDWFPAPMFIGRLLVIEKC